jgi:hypothetical protein
MALRKTLTGNTVKEVRNLGTLTYKIKCKWDNQAKKSRTEVGGQGKKYIVSYR